jgi:hypothetical protein
MTTQNESRLGYLCAAELTNLIFSKIADEIVFCVDDERFFKVPNKLPEIANFLAANKSRRVGVGLVTFNDMLVGVVDARPNPNRRPLAPATLTLTRRARRADLYLLREPVAIASPLLVALSRLIDIEAPLNIKQGEVDGWTVSARGPDYDAEALAHLLPEGAANV